MKTNFVFFGTPEFSTTILDILYQQGLVPSMIVTSPDRKVGRKQILTSPPVALWAQRHGIPLLQPEKPKEVIAELEILRPDFFVVAAYGYILNSKILAIPQRGTLNVHTSLLPKWRGACPIESAILAQDKETGSTIMLMDEQLDHGAILAQESFLLDEHINREELFAKLAQHGGELLAQTIPSWLQGKITGHEQNHDQVSLCSKIEKEDGNISNDDDHLRYRKYLAYYGWPGIFYIDEKGKRIKVNKARYENNCFIIERITPEGKNEMPFDQYQK